MRAHNDNAEDGEPLLVIRQRLVDQIQHHEKHQTDVAADKARLQVVVMCQGDLSTSSVTEERLNLVFLTFATYQEQFAPSNFVDESIGDECAGAVEYRQHYRGDLARLQFLCK